MVVSQSGLEHLNNLNALGSSVKSFFHTILVQSSAFIEIDVIIFPTLVVFIDL